MGVDYHIVIEPQEYDDYTKHISKNKILVMPEGNLGQGSIPARNFVWEHSLSLGANRHWILDDNIRKFSRVNRNKMYEARTGAIFRITEDFVDRYENVALAGFQYDFFTRMCDPLPAYILNTRIYSCLLIKNDIPYRWRGKYNEDTDLSIRVLKDGWCTILTHIFVQHKQKTMSMKGGNTDELYAGDGRLKMAESLVEQHPDVAKVIWRFNRPHHWVDYSQFKNNKLKLKDGLRFEDKVDEHGLVLVKVDKKGKIIGLAE